MKLRAILIISAAVVVLGAVYLLKLMNDKKAYEAMMAMMPPPPTVSVRQVEQVRWATSLKAVASLQGADSIMVRSELAGVVNRIAFSSGAQVRQGDLLVELDTSVERAQLSGLEAAADLAAISLRRAQELRVKTTISQAELDAAEASARQANAAAEQVRAVIAKKHIVAPFSGRVGIRKINVGEFLDAGASIVMLENASSVYADFSLPQGEAPRLAAGLPVRLQVDAFGGREFVGSIEAVNPKVSDSTRNVGVRAIFVNADSALRGGMFGNVALMLGKEESLLAVPTAAIVYSTFGNYVYVLKNDAKVGATVQQQFVTLGEKRGDLVVVLKGLELGQQVVTSGQIKLNNGVPVQVNNAVQPSNDPAPKPSES